MDEFKKAFDWLINDRSDLAMILRTVFEAAFSYITVHLPEILGLFQLSNEAKTLLVGFFTVVYTAVISKVRESRAKKVSE